MTLCWILPLAKCFRLSSVRMHSMPSARRSQVDTRRQSEGVRCPSRPVHSSFVVGSQTDNKHCPNYRTFRIRPLTNWVSLQFQLKGLEGVRKRYPREDPFICWIPQLDRHYVHFKFKILKLSKFNQIEVVIINVGEVEALKGNWIWYPYLKYTIMRCMVLYYHFCKFRSNDQSSQLHTIWMLWMIFNDWMAFHHTLFIRIISTSLWIHNMINQ